MPPSQKASVAAALLTMQDRLTPEQCSAAAEKAFLTKQLCTMSEATSKAIEAAELIIERSRSRVLPHDCETVAAITPRIQKQLGELSADINILLSHLQRLS